MPEYTEKGEHARRLPPPLPAAVAPVADRLHSGRDIPAPCQPSGCQVQTGNMGTSCKLKICALIFFLKQLIVVKNIYWGGQSKKHTFTYFKISCHALFFLSQIRYASSEQEERIGSPGLMTLPPHPSSGEVSSQTRTRSIIGRRFSPQGVKLIFTRGISASRLPSKG